MGQRGLLEVLELGDVRILIIGTIPASLLNFRLSFMRALRERGHEVLTMASGEIAPEGRERIGVHYQDSGLSRTGLNPVRDVWSVVCLQQKVKAAHPQVVFLYGAKSVIYGSLVAQWLGIGAVYSMVTGLGFLFIGGGVTGRIRAWLGSVAYRIALRSNRVVFFHNSDDAALFTERRVVDPKRTVVVGGSGVDVDYYSPLHGVEKDCDFVFVGRLIRDKGVTDYLEVLKLLKREGLSFRALLVGGFDTNPSAISPEYLQAYLNDGLVDYVGEVNDVRPFLARSKVLVLPSYREGMPRSVLEAMAMGLPSIVADVPGCRHAVTHGETGWVVPVRNARQLADAMTEALRAPEECARRGAAARERAVEQFDVRLVNRQLIQSMGL